MPTPLNVIADRLTRELGSWSAIEFCQHEEFRREDSLTPGQGLFTSYRKETRYIETGLGERLLSGKITTPKPAEDSVSVDYCDGKLTANFSSRPNLAKNQDQVVISRTFANERGGASARPFPFGSFYVGSQPIDKAISHASALGTTRWLDRDCDRLLFAEVPLDSNKYSYVFDLDPETSTPLRVTCYLSEEMRRRDLPIYVWSVEKLEQIEGHPVAMLSNYVHYEGSPKDHHVSFRIATTVDRVEFNQSYPKETFWPKITAETKVFDTIHRTVKSPKAKQGTKATTGTPIRADDDRGSLPLAGLVVTLGLLLVIVSVVMAIRRK